MKSSIKSIRSRFKISIWKFFVAGVVLSAVLYIFTSVLFKPAKTVDQVEYVPQVTQELLAKIEVYDSLTDEEKMIVNYQKSFHCTLKGQFCHDDPFLITNEDLEQSVILKASTLIAYPYVHLPASGLESVNTAIANAGVIPEAYAYQGIGSQIISPFQDIWIQVRNASYAIIVLIILIEAFVLMFQIGQDNSVKIESYIPSIIIVIIMIQMSYAVSGFLIDLMYITTIAIYAMLSPILVKTGSGIGYSNLMNHYFFGSPYDLFLNISSVLTGNQEWFSRHDLAAQNLYNIFVTLPPAIMSIFGDLVHNIIFAFLEAYVIGQLLQLGGGALIAWIGTALASGGGTALATGIALVAAPYLLVGLILLFAIIYISWNIFKLILRAYVTVILYTIFAPLFILMSLVPGNDFGIKSWLKGFMSELVVFPVVAGMLFALTAFSNVSRAAATNPSQQSLVFPFLPAINDSFIFLVGLAGVALLPKVVEGMKSLISKSFFSDIDKDVVDTYKKSGMFGFGLINQGTRGIRAYRRGRATPPGGGAAPGGVVGAGGGA